MQGSEIRAAFKIASAVMRKWLAAQFNHVPRKRPLRFTSADRPHVLSRAYATRTASISLQPKLFARARMDLESRMSFATQILGRLQRSATRSALERESYCDCQFASMWMHIRSRHSAA